MIRSEVDLPQPGRSEDADELAAPDVEAQPLVDLFFAERDADILKRDDPIGFHADTQAIFFSC